LIKNGDRIIIGVSGGPDSICLLNILVKLKEEFNLTLFVVHINHSLREEADFEEEYVKRIAAQFNVEFFSKKVDINQLAIEVKKSTEEVARNVRYEFFNEILNKVKANKIAVAHNLNDSVETFLMNLIRGTGIDGLCGIQKENGNIVRPLIDISRDEIEEYIIENKLIAMRDKTNSESIYTRNKIRNELIPYMKEINPEVINSIYRTSKVLLSNREIIKEIISEKYDEIRLKEKSVALDKNKFLQLNSGLKNEILRLAINEFNGDLVDVSMGTIDNAINIIENSQSGAVAKISKNVKIKISYDKLVLFKSKDEIEFCYELNVPGNTFIPEINKQIIAKIAKVEDVPNKYEDRNKCFFDIAKVGKKIYVRNKKDGDFFEPAGMIGRKTLKKFFSDLKIDSDDREKIPLIVNDTDIIWIAGFRASRKFLKDKNTKEVIIFEYGENI